MGPIKRPYINRLVDPIEPKMSRLFRPNYRVFPRTVDQKPGQYVSQPPQKITPVVSTDIIRNIVINEIKTIPIPSGESSAVKGLFAPVPWLYYTDATLYKFSASSSQKSLNLCLDAESDVRWVDPAVTHRAPSQYYPQIINVITDSTTPDVTLRCTENSDIVEYTLSHGQALSILLYLDSGSTEIKSSILMTGAN